MIGSLIANGWVYETLNYKIEDYPKGENKNYILGEYIKPIILKDGKRWTMSKNENEKLERTKYILKVLSEWYKEESANTGDSNDLSILKTQKLIFLLSTINTEGTSNMASLGFTNYKAMPLGPAELDVYNFFKEQLAMAINVKQMNFEELPESSISAEDKKTIDLLISDLKAKNKNLILMSASYLVDLTHKYASWINSFNEAKKKGELINNISMDAIKYSEKFYYL